MIKEICSWLLPWLDGMDGDEACGKTWVAESDKMEEHAALQRR